MGFIRKVNDSITSTRIKKFYHGVTYKLVLGFYKKKEPDIYKFMGDDFNVIVYVNNRF